MTCKEFCEMLDNYANLTDDERVAMAEHAESCAVCREELNFMLEIIDQLNALPKLQPPADFIGKLNERIDIEANSKKRRVLEFIKSNYKYCSTAAACLLLAVVVGINGKPIIDIMVNTPSETPVDPVSNIAETVHPTETPDEIVADVPKTADETYTANAATPAEQTQPAATTRRTAQRTNTARNSAAVREAVTPKIESVPTSNIEVAKQNNETADITSQSETAEADNAAGAYRIAKGNYRMPSDSEMSGGEPDMQSLEDKSRSVSIDKNADMAIAHGRYYIVANDIKVSMDDNEIGLSGDDAQRAIEVIEQYTDVQDADYYVINSENVSQMLEHMDREGIDYHNRVDENPNKDMISFKLVIE